MKAFGSYSGYYDLLYKDKDYSLEVSQLDKLLKQFGKGCKSLLEFGSGTGIHSSILIKNGYEVEGIEISESMINYAKINTVFSPVQGDIRSKAMNRKYDAVFSLFHVMSYMNTNEDVICALENAHLHLDPQGLFVFDFWYTPAVHELKPETRIKRMSNQDTEVLRIAEPVFHTNLNIVDVNYTIFHRSKNNSNWESLSETHKMRHFSLPELYLFATSTGFDVLHAAAFPDGKIPGKDTWGVGVVLRKR